VSLPSSRRVKIKVQNLRAVKWQGIESDDFCFGGDEEKLVCRQHRAEVCGICCLDFALLNSLRAVKVAGAPGESAWVEKAAKVYHASPAPEQNMSEKPHYNGLPEILAKGESSRSFSTPQAVIMASAITYAGRKMASLPPVRAMVEACIHGLRDRDADARQRRDFLEQVSHNEAERAASKVARSGGKSKSKSKGKNTAAKATNMDSGENVERMIVIFMKSGVRSFGSFFEEFDSLTLKQADMDLIHSAPVSADGGTVEVTEGLRKTMEKYKNFMEWMLKHTTVPITDPALWAAGKVEEFLRENSIVPRPCPSAAVLLEVARELIKFKAKMLYAVQNMPDEEKSQRLGAKSAAAFREGKRLSNEDCFSSEEEEKNILESSPVPKELDPSTLGPLRGLIVEALASAGDMKDLATRAQTDEVLKLQMKIALETDDNSMRQKSVVYQFESPEETFGMFIQVLSVKALQGSDGAQIPIIFLKYGFQRRDDLVRPEKVQSFTAAIAEVQKSGVAHVKESTWSKLALTTFARALRRNRKQLSTEVVSSAENAWAGGWFKFSALVLSCESVVRTCPPCGKPASKMCSSCKEVTYCSGECQKAHWKLHKAACRAKASQN